MNPGGSIAHEAVLCEPVRSILAPQPGEIVLDTTAGHGGHASLLAEAVGSAGRVIALDVDPTNLERASAKLAQTQAVRDGLQVNMVRANFREVRSVLDDLGVAGVDLLLADLGVSTDQLLDAGRGLTFAEDGPLDMRLDDRLEQTAADLVNALPEGELADLLYHNAQERFSRRIARKICWARHEKRIRTTGELVRLVCSALGASPSSHGGLHPATRTFLALRMAVNFELENLRELLAVAPDCLRSGGRFAVISFHSGEDRIVKQDFVERKGEGIYEILTKKPVRPSEEEARQNPRSRSAKLRAAKRK